MQPGDEVVPAGTLLAPTHLGVLASVGLTEVLVVPRPRVGLLSTGDELVPPGEPLAPGQIRDSNRPMLVALVAAAGAEPVDLGRVPDDEAVLEARLRDGAAGCDVLVTSGGVSMGEADVVKAVLGRIADDGLDADRHPPGQALRVGPARRHPDPRAARQPGVVASCPSSCSPGRRSAAWPAAPTSTGRWSGRSPTPTCAAGADGKTHFLRVRTAFDGTKVRVAPVGAQGSHQLAATASADGLACLPDGEGVAAGDAVDVLLLAAEATLTRSP